MSTAAQPVYEYGPIGAAKSLFYAHDAEVLMSGPAGTGKSRACLQKLDACARKYSGMRGLIVRKTRHSLTESGLVTFEEKVLPPKSRIKLGPQRRFRQSYKYPNRSEIIVAGLDDPTRIMSTEFDLAYIQEATEVTENDWEMLTTRLRNGVMPYQQLLADCNPGSPSHWLKKRSDQNRTLLIESRHEDNPTIWDVTASDWTPKGKVYIEKLDNLTGVRFLRLRKGIWAAAEGMVWEGYDPVVHLIDRFTIPKDWPRFWSIDFGFTNPFVCQFWAQDGDGRLYLYRELYRTQRLVEDHAKDILEAAKDDPRPRAIICDHDAEGRATLQKHTGMNTLPAKKAVSEGIQTVAARFKSAGDGKPRIFILRDSLVYRDTLLEEAKKPCCTSEEIEGYTYPQGKDGKPLKEEPVKENDHGCDAMRYMVAHFDLGGHVSLW